MKIQPKLLSLALVTLLGVSACSSKPPVTAGIGTQKLSAEQKFGDFLKVDNDELSQILAISDVKVTRSNGFLKTNVELTSFDEKSQHLQYKFNWFDAQGFPIENNKSPWKYVELHGGQTTNLTALAPQSQATTFNVYVRTVPAKAYEY